MMAAKVVFCALFFVLADGQYVQYDQGYPQQPVFQQANEQQWYNVPQQPISDQQEWYSPQGSLPTGVDVANNMNQESQYVIAEQQPFIYQDYPDYPQWPNYGGEHCVTVEVEILAFSAPIFDRKSLPQSAPHI